VTGVLVVNAGSSSLKLRVLAPDDTVTAALDLSPWDGSPDDAALARFLAGVAGSGQALGGVAGSGQALGGVAGSGQALGGAAGSGQAERGLGGRDGVGVVGHRVVHGGRRFTAPVLIDDGVMAGIGDLTDLAPLHQPRALAGIAATRSALPGVPEVACFDTAFHAGLPPAAATYALPLSWTRRFGLRRFGFHGLSHAYAAGRAAQLVGGIDAERLRVVTCHLGAGSSLAAVKSGECVDTTMGFTPLEGLVMATRSGNVDPGLLVWLQQHGGLSVAEVSDGLEFRAGLAGVAGLPSGSGDIRDVRLAAGRGDPQARLALDVHAHRLRGQIAAMAAAMDGLDALVFTGGIGEHQPETRAEAAAGLSFLGVVIEESRNAAAQPDCEISAAGAAVRTLVIAAREDIEIARQCRAVLAGRQFPGGAPPG
jgi:acetate kinase